MIQSQAVCVWTECPGETRRETADSSPPAETHIKECFHCVYIPGNDAIMTEFDLPPWFGRWWSGIARGHKGRCFPCWWWAEKKRVCMNPKLTSSTAFARARSGGRTENVSTLQNVWIKKTLLKRPRFNDLFQSWVFHNALIYRKGISYCIYNSVNYSTPPHTHIINTMWMHWIYPSAKFSATG